MPRGAAVRGPSSRRFGMEVGEALQDREARAAKNESRFREINERIERANEGFPFAFSVNTWICECSSETCVERLQLSAEEYEGIRSDGARFLVAPSKEHVWLEIEKVSKRCDRFWVVEKNGEAAELAERADPRADSAYRLNRPGAKVPVSTAR
jgi:hypothetical protein